jgi:hypothetical protein
MYDLIVKYVETGDPTFLERVARDSAGRRLSRTRT